MNMIIAIMAQTYSQVNETKLQSELEQKIALIYDYLDLIDITQVFKQTKYIIHAYPAQTDTVRDVNLEEEIEELGNTITKSFNHRLEEVERNIKSMMGQMNSKTYQIQRDMIDLHISTEEIKKMLNPEQTMNKEDFQKSMMVM